MPRWTVLGASWSRQHHRLRHRRGARRCLLRLNPNGTLDSNFAGGGQTSLRFSAVTAADDLAGALVLRSNGEILVGGGALSVDGRSDAVLQLNASGGLIARLNGLAIGGADLRVVAGLATSDGGALWLVRRTGASLALGSAYFWRMDANLANFSGYGTGGHKGIVSGGPETGCGTQFEHVPTAVVATPGRFRAFGHALVNGVARAAGTPAWTMPWAAPACASAA